MLVSVGEPEAVKGVRTLYGPEKGPDTFLFSFYSSEQQILAWADLYRKRHGRWPTEPAGLIPRSAGETWSGVDQALRAGLRGLPGGSSLPQLLAAWRDYHHRHQTLTLTQILRWADAHRAHTGRWPTTYAGPVREAPGETWSTLDHALRVGVRGLPGGSSLTCLLAEARGAPHHLHPARLSVAQVLAWADDYQGRTGRWPRPVAEPVAPGAPVSWRTVDHCLRYGLRGLPAGGTLVRLLAQHGRGSGAD